MKTHDPIAIPFPFLFHYLVSFTFVSFISSLLLSSPFLLFISFPFHSDALPLVLPHFLCQWRSDNWGRMTRKEAANHPFVSSLMLYFSFLCSCSYVRIIGETNGQTKVEWGMGVRGDRWQLNEMTYLHASPLSLKSLEGRSHMMNYDMENEW